MRLFAAASLLACLGSSLLAQDAPRPRPSDVFEVPAGCDVNLFAESPELFNPTAMDVDHKGRVWVTEAVNYRKWRGGNKGRTHGKGDRVVILTDTDGDGKCDKSQVFVQEPELLAPLGICVIGNQILVSCSPHAILYTDTNGDDKPDRRELFLTGFGGKDHDHGLHSFVAGADGYLYFNTGNAGPHIVKDKSGFQVRIDRRRDVMSDDGRRWFGGAVLRVRPDGTGLRVLAHNFRNPYEVAVDAFGNLFQSDNDDDGNRSCRTTFVVDGGNYGFRSADGRRAWRADRRPNQKIFAAHWHQEDPGVMPAGVQNGAGGPTGVAIYEGDFSPGCPDGAVLNCDAGAGVVYAHLPVRQGSGFQLTKTIFMQVEKGTGGKRAKWFRPSDVVVGPRGAVYVADWYDPGVGGHATGDRAAYGRILRVSGPAEKRANLDFASTAGLARIALENPSPNVRAHAARSLRERGPEGHAIVTNRWRNSQQTRVRARALSWLAATANGAKTLAAGLESRSPDIRITAARLSRLHLSPRDAFASLRKLAGDANSSVRREVLLAMREVPLATCLDDLVRIAAAVDPADRWMVETIGSAAAGRESAVYTSLLAAIGDHPTKWSTRFATLAWRLHPIESVPAHLARALAVHLPVAARRQSIDAIAFVKDKTAAEAMGRLATTGPVDTRTHAGYWLQHRATNDWRTFGIGTADSTLADAELLWRSGVLTSGEKAFDLAVTPGRTVFLVVDEGTDGYSHDWAAWLEPAFSSAANAAGKKKPLMQLRWTNAKTGWGQVRKNRNAGGGILSLDGKTRRRGIGTHAPSEIAYRVPAGMTRLRGSAGPDHGGTSQPGSATRLEFRIYQEKARQLGPIPAWRAALLDPKGTTADQRKVAIAMAKHHAGGRVLLGLLEQGKLPTELHRTVAKEIFRNPDRAVRLQAAKHFPIPGTENLKLPSLDAIAKLTGRPAKGAPHFARVCAACHLFGGQGKDIGPDLSAIGKKYDTAALLEAILNPNAGISFGYETWLIEKRDGSFVTGFVLADGATLVVKDQEGKRHAIPRSQIRTKQKSTTSMMPPALVTGMSAQDLADLIAFLRR